MAAALTRLLRGGRSGGSSQPLLLPGICRRGPQEGQLVGRVLQRPGASAPASPASGLLARLTHTGGPVSPSPLENLRKKVFIPGPVRYVPYDSEESILSLADRFDKVHYKLQMIRRHLNYLAALALVIITIEVGFLVHNYLQLKANQKSAEEFEVAVEQIKADLKELELLQSQIEEEVD